MKSGAPSFHQTAPRSSSPVFAASTSPRAALSCIASRVRSAALTARRASIKACTSASRASAGRSGLVARHKRPQTTRYRPSGVRRGPSAACLGVALRMCGRNAERRGSEPCLPRMRCREAGGEPSELTIRGLAAVEVERTRRLAERVGSDHLRLKPFSPLQKACWAGFLSMFPRS